MPESGQPSAVSEHVVQRPRHTVPLGHDEELVRLLAGAPVQRPGQGGQPSAERVVGVQRTDAATRTAIVEVASSWSARRTSAAFTAATGTTPPTR